ncbi:glycosyltransferase family 87 protein [Jatrophihabitans sp. DSM 45814]
MSSGTGPPPLTAPATESSADQVEQPPAPSLVDPTVQRASAVIGGPIGRYARTGGGWWTPMRVLLAIAAFTLLLGYGEKSPCADGKWVANSQYTHVCYSDVIPLWGAEGLADGAVPYRDHAVEYPVVTGGFMWITAELTHGWHAVVMTGSDEGVVFGVLTCVLLAICGLLAVAATVGAAGQRRQWDAAIFAASPLLVFHAFSNWDLLAMAFTSGALWAWARNRPIAAGVLIGLGAAAKLYPALLLIPLVLLAYRTRVWRPVLWAGAAAALTWLAVNLPVAFAWTRGWWEFYSFSSSRPAEASTFWAMLNHFFPKTFATANSGGWVPSGVVVALALLVAVGAVSWLALTAPSRPRLAQLMFLVVVAFLMTTKVWSPQYSLWLVPLLALARPRWRMALIWQFTEIAVWIGTLLWLVGDAHSLSYEGLTWLLLIRDGTLLTLAGMIVYEIRRPEADVIRTADDPDPGAGLFATAKTDRVLGRNSVIVQA